jgi:hypothetical protein
MHYIFTCKPGDHTDLMQWLEDFKDDWAWTEHTDDKKERKHRYCWRNNVPLSGQENTPNVNFLAYEEINIKTGNVIPVINENA